MRSLMLLGWVVLVFLRGCHSPGFSSEEQQRSRPNWLVLAPDSLRADRIPLEHAEKAGFNELTAPQRKGVLFRNMFSQGSWTLPALASFLTGRFPLGTSAASQRVPFLPAGRTLPEILSYYGYTTAVFWGPTIPGPESAFSRGFQQVSRLSPGELAGAEDLHGETALAWLGSEPPEPFFALVHDTDLHAGMSEHSIPENLVPSHESPAWAAYRESLVRRYDVQVAGFQAYMSSLLQVLDEHGQAERTIVVLISNHGEDLAEHGLVVNHGLLYDTCLRVPLVIADPTSSEAGKVVDTRVQTVDVTATILARSGIMPEQGMDGQSLLSLMGQGGEPYQEHDIFSMTGRYSVSLRTADKKLILWSGRFYDLTPDRRAGESSVAEQVELYDLTLDPYETRNLAESAEKMEPSLLSILSEWRERQDQENAAVSHERLDEHEKQVMQEKGYWQNPLRNQESTP